VIDGFDEKAGTAFALDTRSCPEEDPIREPYRAAGATHETTGATVKETFAPPALDERTVVRERVFGEPEVTVPIPTSQADVPSAAL